MNRTGDLIPRQPRRMRQPSKDTLREQLALAADVIARQRADIERLSRPWWLRLLRRNTYYAAEAARMERNHG